MKTCFLILAAWVALAADAQPIIGVRSGLSIASLYGSNAREYDWREGLYGSLYMPIKLNRLFYLQPEINYSPQGGLRDGMQELPMQYVDGIKIPPGTRVYASFVNTTHLNYVEIPVLIKLVVRQELAYSVYLGPYISYLISAKNRMRGNSRLYLDKHWQIPFTPNGEPVPAVSIRSDSDLRDVTRKINGGIQAGVGVGYPLWGGYLCFDTRVIAGLTHLYSNRPADGNNQTGSVVLTIGYEFAFR